jgi:hypothetical protein
MFPDLFRHSRRKNRSVAAALADETWIRDLMHDLTPDILSEYIMLWMLLDEVAFDPTDQQSDEITRLAQPTLCSSRDAQRQTSGVCYGKFGHRPM